MSTQSFINRESVRYLMLNEGKYLLGDKLVSIRLQVPTIESMNRKEKANSGKIATKENHAESLDNLQESAMLEFSFTIISPVTYTSHAHKLLALQNQTAQEFSDTFKIFANIESIELERDTFLGQVLSLTDIHALIKNYVKLGKSQKAAQKWRKNKGAYSVSRNGEFVPYSESAESVNLAPAIVPSTYITDVNKAWAQALKEEKARQNLIKA